MITAAVVCLARSGSQFLIDALGSHPDIHAAEGEPFLSHGPIRDHTVTEVARLAWDHPGYAVTAAKLTYGQVTCDLVAIWRERQTRIIHLIRQNVRDIAVSHLLCLQKKGEVIDWRTHYEPGMLVNVAERSIVLDLDMLAQRIQVCIDVQRTGLQAVQSWELPTLTVTYEDMVGGRNQSAAAIMPAVAQELCQFLGVSEQRLTSKYRRVLDRPPSDFIANWEEIEQCEAIYHPGSL